MQPETNATHALQSQPAAPLPPQAKLSHVNIVEVRRVLLTRAHLGIVQTYEAGGDLQVYCQKYKCVTCYGGAWLGEGGGGGQSIVLLMPALPFRRLCHEHPHPLQASAPPATTRAHAIHRGRAGSTRRLQSTCSVRSSRHSSTVTGTGSCTETSSWPTSCCPPGHPRGACSAPPSPALSAAWVVPAAGAAGMGQAPGGVTRLHSTSLHP